MTRDALEPGPGFTFPNVPRTPAGYLDTDLMPIGPRWQRGPDGRSRLVDMTPTVRLANGSLARLTDIVPPPPGYLPPHPGHPRNP